MSNRLLGVEYDPVSAKLYASRKIAGTVNVLPTSIVSSVTDTSYSLSPKDSEKILVFDSSNATIEITSQTFLLGTKIELLSGEGNSLTISGNGVNIKSAVANTTTDNTYHNSYSHAKIVLTYISTDTWLIEGAVASEAMKSYVVTANAGKYYFTGGGLTDAENPDLTFTVGQFVQIDSQAGSSHPFWIKKGDISGASTGTGVTAPGWALIKNNGTDSTANKLRVSFTESGSYYYICQAHSTMKGSITVL